MVPLIKAMGPSFGGDARQLPLWDCPCGIAPVGACFGGKGTLVEASANLTVAGIAQREGIACGFLTDFWCAAP